jgi:hypothetical protein
VIERARDRAVPAVYLGWPGGLAELFWQFYTVKHGREDLLGHTIPALAFDPAAIAALPAGSIVITTPSREIDAGVNALLTQGVVTNPELVRAPDGTPVFWILDRAQ